MDVTNVIGLLGGLALFLYGMQMMSTGLEVAAGKSMKSILEKLTSNRFMGVAIGAGMTALVQSSSATTVMTVGFVNSKLMTLNQAVWIIMGANIGTTITGQLIALDVVKYAPIFTFIGVIFIMFIKNNKLNNYGQVIAGLGVIFIGMEMMSTSVMPLRESQAFIDLVVKFKNPIIGILVGAIFTAAIQSSAASIGILQALAVSGLIDLSGAVYVLFGQNIGTCITAVLASIGTSRNAKRTTLIHMLFNVIGTAIFTIICMATPLTEMVQNFTPSNEAAQIANMHTLFNIATTLMLLPFGNQLAKLSIKMLPEVEDENEDNAQKLEYINPTVLVAEHRVGSSLIIIDSIEKEIKRMLSMARKNVERSFNAVLTNDVATIKKVEKTEEYIDYLNKEISKYISAVIAHENNANDSKVISALYKMIGNVERIGDHAMNICEYTNILSEKKIAFSAVAQGEITEMKNVTMKALGLLDEYERGNEQWLGEIRQFEQKMDDMKLSYKQNQINRMKSGSCSDEASIIYSEMLTDFERIGDHILNIGQEIVYGIDD